MFAGHDTQQPLGSEFVTHAAGHGLRAVVGRREQKERLVRAGPGQLRPHDLAVGHQITQAPTTKDRQCWGCTQIHIHGIWL